MNDGLGSRLLAVRRMAKMSQEEMALRLGVSRSAYQYYERGQRDVTGAILTKIYHEFDVDPIWVLEGESDSGRSRQYIEISTVYRRILRVVESRIHERGMSVSPEKKCDAIEFIVDEILRSGSIDTEGAQTDPKRIDTVLGLIA